MVAKPQLIWKSLLVVISILVLSLVFTIGGFWAFSRGNMVLSRALFRASIPASLTSKLWYEGVWLGNKTSDLWLKAQALGSQEEQLALLKANLPETADHFQQFSQHFQAAWWPVLLIDDAATVSHQLTNLAKLAQLTSDLITSEGQYLLLLQNTDEVRATGGFIGSYASLDFSLVNPEEIEIRDIYDPSGISFTVPAPAGQAEYLSGGLGMKLHDANWSPDFPSSAQLIMRYFNNIKLAPQAYDGVIAVPLSAVTDLVEAMGDIYLVDQDAVVTAEDFSQVIRRDREAFFPGSRDKQQSLQQFYTALRLKLTQLEADQWLAVAQVLASDQFLSELQFYAANPAVEETFRTVGLSGETGDYAADEIYLFPVESNVGINKANKKVSRSLSLSWQDKLLLMTTTFNNGYTMAERPPAELADSQYATATHLGYVNYYRVLVRPDMRVRQILVNGEARATWDEEIVVSDNGNSYLQVGFLISVPEEQQTVVEVGFSLPTTTSERYLIQRQVGVVYQQLEILCSDGQLLAPALSGNFYQASCFQEVE